MSAAKKRSPSKGKGGGQRRGLSGNPQRRAGQLRDKQPGPARAGAVVSPPAAGPAPDPSVMRELAYRMAGGADPAPWWRESHDRVLARARAASWPRRDVEIEDLTCQIMGGELFDCLERSLADGDGSVGWHGLSSLLRGIALTAPRTPPARRTTRACFSPASRTPTTPRWPKPARPPGCSPAAEPPP